MPPEGTAPPALAGVDAIVTRVAADPAALLSDDVLAASAALTELEAARLKLRLREVKIKLGDFNRLLSARRREACEKEARERRATCPDPTDWRTRLRPDKVTGDPRPSLFNLKIILANTYGHRLSFDEMASIPLLDGKPFQDADITGIRCDIEEREDLEFSRATAEEAIVYVARQRSYHPVRQYLRALVWDKTKRLDKVAADYFGATDALSRMLVVRWFTATAARAMDPGCKFDTALVLFGDEGYRKSTFFRVLGGSWFKDSKVDITDRKGMMLMHSAWIYEWPEIDRMLERKHDSDVKAFVTQQDDSFVPMYGRSVATLLRSNVTVGTTNKEKFITSDTGSRRWWVVTVSRAMTGPLLERLHADRDQLWAEAVARHDAFKVAEEKPDTRGDANPWRWWLTEAEEAGRAERNEEHLTASPDVEAVDTWLRGEPLPCNTCKGSGAGFGTDKITGSPNPCGPCSGAGKVTRAPLPKDPTTGREYVTQADILNGPLGVPLERHQQNALRVASVLRRLEWRSGKRIRPKGAKGPRIVPYYSPEENVEADEREAIMGAPS